MPGTARGAALAVLEKCRRNAAWSDSALDAEIKRQALDSRDAALASRLCYGVLQNTALCDFCIDAVSSVKSKKLEPKVLDILRLSVFQLLFLDKIPASAAVNEGVKLCKASGFSRASGLVNAVLRRVAEGGGDLPEIPGRGTAAYLVTRYSHPEWLVDELIDMLGYDEAEALLKINNEAAPVTAQVNTLKTDVESALAELPGVASPCRRFADCIEFNGGSPEGVPAFGEGRLYVQDMAARLAVTAAAPVPGMRVLDACAAPGGKSFAAAIMMGNRGSILSCDIHEKKLGQILRGASRLGIDIIETKTMDARSPDEQLYGGFDLVIADAPCSGLGVIRKKPEIRYKNPAALAGLPAIQFDILSGISRCVAPGGLLLYSTCTFRRVENEDVVSAFVDKNSDFTPESFWLPGEIGAVNDGMITLWPHIHGTDGFFICRLRRAK